MGSRLRRLREARGWSLKQLSGESGVSLAAVQRIEVGATSVGLATVVALCKALGESVGQLVRGAQGVSPGGRFTHVAVPRRPSQSLDLTGTLARAYLKSQVLVVRALQPFLFPAEPAQGALLAYLLSGGLDIALADGSTIRLGVGDALHLHLPEPMQWHARGSEEAKVLCIVDGRAIGELATTPCADPPSDPDNASIGERLKARRLMRKLTLSRLADLARVPASTISKIENGRLQPSLVQAIGLAEALGANLAFLAGPYRDRPQLRSLVRAADRQALHYPELGLGLQDLNDPFLRGLLEARLGQLAPGAHSGAEPMTHHGDELCFVLQGVIRYRFDDGADRITVELHADECLQFKADTPHAWENAADGATQVLWVFSDGLSF